MRLSANFIKEAEVAGKFQEAFVNLVDKAFGIGKTI